MKKVHCHQYSYMDTLGKELLYKIIDKEYEIGKALGMSKDEISEDLDCYLIGVYSYFGDFVKAYDVMVLMAEKNNYWICMDIPTLKWAKDNGVIYKIHNAVERGLVNYRVQYERREDFEKYLKKIKEIRGY